MPREKSFKEAFQREIQIEHYSGRYIVPASIWHIGEHFIVQPDWLRRLHKYNWYKGYKGSFERFAVIISRTFVEFNYGMPIIPDYRIVTYDFNRDCILYYPVWLYPIACLYYFWQRWRWTAERIARRTGHWICMEGAHVETGHWRNSFVYMNMENKMNIREIQEINTRRAQRWHNGNFKEWSGLEWAGALCGEAGEAANVAKKLKRLESKISGNAFSERPLEANQLVKALRGECADVFLYLCLLAARYDIDLENAIIEKFNSKSIEMGFPERLDSSTGSPY